MDYFEKSFIKLTRVAQRFLNNEILTKVADFFNAAQYDPEMSKFSVLAYKIKNIKKYQRMSRLAKF